MGQHNFVFISIIVMNKSYGSIHIIISPTFCRNQSIWTPSFIFLEYSYNNFLQKFRVYRARTNKTIHATLCMGPISVHVTKGRCLTLGGGGADL